MAAKKKRANLQERRNSRANDVRETVVKCALLKYLHGDVETKVRVRDDIRTRVSLFSRRVCIASVTLSGMVKEFFGDVADLGTRFLPVDVFDQTLIRQLMLGQERANIPNPWPAAYIRMHPQPVTVHGRNLGDSNMYTAGARKYVTNLKNSLTTNFLPRLKRYLRNLQKIHAFTDVQFVTSLYAIHGWAHDRRHDSWTAPFPETKQVTDIIDGTRRLLGLSRGQVVDDDWFKDLDNLACVLRWFVYLNRFNAANGFREFDVVPVCRIKTHFVTLDTSDLYGVMKTTGMVSCSNFEQFDALRDAHWRSFLNHPRLQGRLCTFTGTIETDGVSLCVHFSRPRKPLDDPCVEPDDPDANPVGPLQTIATEGGRVVAIDPGRVSIYYAVEKLADDRGFRTFELSRKRFYAQSGIDSAEAWTNRWRAGDEIRDATAARSRVSSKGASFRSHLNFRQVYFATWDAEWTEALKPRWARQRLRLYGGKKRVFAQFWNEVRAADPKRSVTVAYGAGGFASGGRGEKSVPNKRALAESRSRHRTAMIDEFRTSKICHFDDSILQCVGVEGRRYSLRGLLWCRSTTGKGGKFVSRDFNGAVNILRCATDPERPVALTRIRGVPRIVDVVGIRINDDSKQKRRATRSS